MQNRNSCHSGFCDDVWLLTQQCLAEPSCIPCQQVSLLVSERRVGSQQPACCLESLVFSSEPPCPSPRWLPQARCSQQQVRCESSQVAVTTAGRPPHLGRWWSSDLGLRCSAPIRKPLLGQPHATGLGPRQVNDVVRKETRTKGHQAHALRNSPSFQCPSVTCEMEVPTWP